MDALSRLFTLHPVYTTSDRRCRIPASSHVDSKPEPSGTAPYYVVLNGALLVQPAGHAPQLLQAGEVLLLPHGDAHGLSASSGADVLCGRFHAGSPVTAALLKGLPPLVRVNTADRPELAGIGTLATMLGAEASAGLPGTAAVSSHLASALFALLLRAWLEQAASVQGLFGLLAETRLTPVVQHMLQAPGAPCTVDQMADACHMSRTTLIRLFRDAVGNGPAEVLTHLRMMQAAEWLVQGTRSVRDISEAAGYQSEAAFSRAFKRFHGKGPGEFRRRQA